MGACGCGDSNGLVRFRGPGRTWYGLEVYPGCRDCATDPALAVYTMAEGDDLGWDFWEDVPAAEFDRHGMWATPLIDLTKLVAAFEEWLGDTDLEEDDGYDPPGAVHDFVHEGEVGRVIADTVWPTPTTAPEAE
jgi:hypothetical protein